MPYEIDFDDEGNESRGREIPIEWDSPEPYDGVHCPECGHWTIFHKEWDTTGCQQPVCPECGWFGEIYCG